MKSGKVYLIGAGPGDPGLITVKGRKYLAEADVIIYDRLLDENLLACTKQDAERIYVGKASSDHTMSQGKINKLLVRKAKEGKTVARLKGGDPFVFGRGGEEALELAANGIAFDVIPGVTAAIAVPSYAGIPVTHRACASSFAVITGHEDPTKADSSIKWEKLATGVDTIVILMGMQNIAEIIAKVIEHGRSADTPVAVISEGTRSQQKTIVGTLRGIVSLIKRAALMPPAVIVVGEVVKLRESICWFENRPLFGKRILVTRARQQASVLSKILVESGALPVELPAITIKSVANNKEIRKAILNLMQYQWIIFTSVNGVEAFFDQLRIFKMDSRALHGLKIATIGPATGKALEKRGITVDFCPDIFTTEGLISGFQNRAIAGQHFLLPRTDIVDKELENGLTSLGAVVHEMTVYHTLPDSQNAMQIKEKLLSHHIDVITFTSSSTVDNLIKTVGDDRALFNGVTIACIGPKTAGSAIKAGLKPDIIAREHTILGLVAAVEEFFTREV